MGDFDVEKQVRLMVADVLKKRLSAINKKNAPVHPRKSFYTEVTKRILDLGLSSVALTITLPFNVIFGIITYFDVGDPIFFVQDRVGKNGKIFKMIKFRNMTNATDENGELLPPEQRITKFGRFMRRTSMDELLNFWSIFKGDMSIIGPRPLLPEYTDRYSERHKMRLCVKPGLECPQWKPIDHVYTWQDQFENDVWYVENISFVVDCKMIGKLLHFMLDRKSADARADVKRGIFMGYSKEGKAISLEDVDPKIIDACRKAAGKID